MRILFTFSGGFSHFDPMIPLARAAQAAGHVVAATGQGTLAPHIEEAGFPAFPSGPDDDTPTPGKLFDRSVKHAGRGIAGRFARRYAPHRAADLLPLCLEWKPDLLVCGEVDFGAMVIAEHLGLPHAAVLAFAVGSRIRPDELAEPLDELRAEYGLPPDPDADMLHRYLRLSPFPPTLRHPEAPLPGGHAFRSEPLPPGSPPPWATALPGAPTVYFTLGTVFNTESGDLFSRVLSGLSELDLNVLVTLGPGVDAELIGLGPQPPNVHIEQFVPQAMVLPHCDLVISHGGSGSVLGAIAHGLPSVLIPIGADQPQNSARCADLGLAHVLDAPTATPADIRDAVNTVLTTPTYRQAARRLQLEFAALPTPAQTIPLLEHLTP